MALAAAALPELTGRVVDDAHVLSAAAKADLQAKLAGLEAKSTIQLVVATVPDLGGDEIEPYANALFRHWGLGRKDKNNGVLFLVAPTLHRMRIEVGYGLEGTLTDATSKLILANAAGPRFKQGDYDGGVKAAVGDIIVALTTDSANWKPEMKPPQDNGWVVGLVFLLIFAFFVYRMFRASRSGWRRAGGAGAWVSSGGWSSGGGGSSGGSSDSGFSGGGGSSGGGGASDSW